MTRKGRRSSRQAPLNPLDPLRNRILIHRRIGDRALVAVTTGARSGLGVRAGCMLPLPPTPVRARLSVSGDVQIGALVRLVYRQGERPPSRATLNRAPLNPAALSAGQKELVGRLYSALNTALWPWYAPRRLQVPYWLHCSVSTPSAN